MAYKPQHLRRGVAKTTPGYEGRHRLEDAQPAALTRCVDPECSEGHTYTVGCQQYIAPDEVRA